MLRRFYELLKTCWSLDMKVFGGQEDILQAEQRRQSRRHLIGSCENTCSRVLTQPVCLSVGLTDVSWDLVLQVQFDSNTQSFDFMRFILKETLCLLHLHLF